MMKKNIVSMICDLRFLSPMFFFRRFRFNHNSHIKKLKEASKPSFYGWKKAKEIRTSHVLIATDPALISLCSQ